MDDRTENQPSLDRWDEALRYLCAAVPMLLFAATDVSVVLRNPDRIMSALVDVGLGLAGLALIRWRRRWPLPIALATALPTAVAAMPTGPALVAYVSLCTHRRWRQILLVGGVSWLCLATRVNVLALDQPTVITTVAGTAVLGGMTLLGLYLRGRRDLEASQREAALTAEREEAQRIEQAKLAERANIAQEMHDVLAHRLSLLSMLAGGLAYRMDLSAEEAREAAQAIQQNAHQSLNELRSVLGTLRADGALEAPQPDLAHVNALFDEVRAAGQRLDVADTIVGRDLLPTQTGRHAYRIVQEALTNARKHAPGSRVRVGLGGQPGKGLRIQVTNPTAYQPPAAPGGRVGLVGLAERTRMAGGTLHHAVRDGRFVLEVWLPWEA